MAHYLTLGAAIAATFQVVVPQQTLLGLGQGALVSVLVLMGLAVILSICSTVDAFIALAFAGSFLPGALLAFLVFGPMIDLKSVLLFETTFRRRTVAALVALTTLLVAGVAIGINAGEVVARWWSIGQTLTTSVGMIGRRGPLAVDAERCAVGGDDAFGGAIGG